MTSRAIIQSANWATTWWTSGYRFSADTLLRPAVRLSHLTVPYPRSLVAWVKQLLRDLATHLHLLLKYRTHGASPLLITKLHYYVVFRHRGDFTWQIYHSLNNYIVIRVEVTYYVISHLSQHNFAHEAVVSHVQIVALYGELTINYPTYRAFFLNRPLLPCGVEGFLLVNLWKNW
jgi:hypothetical protein